jgi:hypothetical protein
MHEDMGTNTHLEPGQEVLSRTVDVQALAEVLDLVKCESPVAVDVSSVPTLLLNLCVQSTERSFPHAKDIFRGSDEVEDLVVSIEDADRQW